MNAERVTARAARLAARLGGALILISAVLVGADVLVRNLGLSLKVHSFDLTKYAFAAAIAFSFAHAAATRSHIRIDILYTYFPIWLKAVLDALAVLSLAAISVGMAWHAWRVVAHSARLGARPNSTLELPLAAPQAVWAAGLTFFACVMAVLALGVLRRLIRRDWAGLHDTAGPRPETAKAAPE